MMSVVIVFRNEFEDTIRSLHAGGIVVALWLLVAAIVVFDRAVYAAPLRAFWDVQLGLIILAPVVVSSLCYGAIVDARTSRRLCFHLGNGVTRLEYLCGAFLARWAVVIIATESAILLGYIIAALQYPTPPSFIAVVGFSVASTGFVLAFAGVYVAISVVAQQQSTAMVGVVLVYVALIPFVIGISDFSLSLLVRTIGEQLGAGVTDSTVQFVSNLTPYPAYAGIAKPVFEPIAAQYPRLPEQSSGAPQTLTAHWWFDVLVLSAWMVLPLAIAYWRFSRDDLL